MKTINGEKYYSRKEMCEKAGVTIPTLNLFIARNNPKAVRRGHMKFYSGEVLEAFLSRKGGRKDRETKPFTMPEGSAGLNPRLAAVREKYRGGIPAGEIERWINGVFNVRQDG